MKKQNAIAKVLEVKPTPTLSGFISDKYRIFNDQAHGKTLPNLVKTRAWVGLLLLTQSTKPEHNLTQAIVEISRMLNTVIHLRPAMHDKYNELLDPTSPIHNRYYNEDEYMTRVVAVCAPLDYIRHWYFEGDEEPPFDLNAYSKLYEVIKKEAEKVFSKSIWSI